MASQSKEEYPFYCCMTCKIQIMLRKMLKGPKALLLGNKKKKKFFWKMQRLLRQRLLSFSCNSLIIKRAIFHCLGDIAALQLYNFMQSSWERDKWLTWRTLWRSHVAGPVCALGAHHPGISIAWLLPGGPSSARSCGHLTPQQNLPLYLSSWKQLIPT